MCCSSGGDGAGTHVPAREEEKMDLAKALRDWGRRRGQLDAGEMTPDEYSDWKDTYLP